MICIKCGSPIPESSKAIKYCSARCSRLYLKSQWKKRTREHQNAYQREYRARGTRTLTDPSKLRSAECLKCGATDDLQAAHIKPLGLGGPQKLVVTFCRTHHMRYNNVLKDFWYHES